MFANEGEATVLVQGNTTVFPGALVTWTCKVRRYKMERTLAELRCFIIVVIINVECRVELHDRQTDSDECCNSESSWLIYFFFLLFVEKNIRFKLLGHFIPFENFEEVRQVLIGFKKRSASRFALNQGPKELHTVSTCEL